MGVGKKLELLMMWIILQRTGSIKKAIMIFLSFLIKPE